MSKSASIREKYANGRQGKTYAQIGREVDGSRQLAHTVLSRKARRLTGRKPRAGSARPFVLRLS